MKSKKSSFLKKLTAVVFMLVNMNVIRGQELIVDFTYTPDNPCSGITVLFNSEVSGGSGNPDNWTYDWRIDWLPFSDQPDAEYVFNTFGCGNHEYVISLIVKDTSFTPPEEETVNKTIQVRRRPDPLLEDIENIVDFSNCDNYPPPSPDNPEFTVVVNDITPDQNCIVPNSYTIEWGDGFIEENLPLGFTNLSHTYMQLGAYDLKFKANGTNGCEGETTYLVRNETYPTGAIDLHGSYTPVCAPVTYQFIITGHEDNSASTTYLIDFGDGNTSQNTHNSLLPPYNFIEHTYRTSSCVFSPPYFTVSLCIQNSCGEGFSTRSTAIIWAPPLPRVDTTQLKGCVGDLIYFINTSVPGFIPGCEESNNYYWVFGNGNTSTLQQPQPQIFNQAGVFDGYLVGSNFCDEDGDTLHFKVYIDPLPVASASPDINTECVPFDVSFANTSSGGELSFNWDVIPHHGWEFINDTQSNSAEPSIQFTAKGVYTITFTAENNCDEDEKTFSITAKDVPDISLNNLPALDCAPFTFENPSATFEPSYGTIDSILWTFAGGNPASSNLPDPGQISYENPGTYEIIIAAHNECGWFATTYQFTLIDQPELTQFPEDFTVCQSQEPILLSAEVNGNLVAGIWESEPPDHISADGIFIPALPGTFTINFTYQTSPSCVVNGSLVIQVNETPEVNAGADVSICMGDTEPILLEGTPAGGEWTGHANIFQDGGNYFFDPENLSVGAYDLRYSFEDSATDCEGEDFMIISILSQPNPEFTISAPYCVDYPVDFIPHPNPPGTLYTWHFDDDIENSTGPVTRIFTTPGTVNIKLIATAPGNCIDSTMHEILVSALPPQPEFAINTDSICASDSVLISVDPAFLEFDGQSTWLIDGVPFSSEIIPDPGYVSFPSGEFTYYHTITWELFNDCEVKSESKTITVKPLPVSIFELDFDPPPCSPCTVTFVNESIGEPKSFFWDFGINGETSVERVPPPRIYTTGEVPTTYQVCLNTENDCGEADSCLLITILPNSIQAGFGYNPWEVCVGEEVFFESYLYDSDTAYKSMDKTWDFGDSNLYCCDSSTITHEYSDAGVFQVTLTGNNGCSISSATHPVTVNPLPDLCYTFTDSVCAGTPVQFNNCSPSGIANRKWLINGHEYTELHPVHTFSSSGIFEVVLSGKTNKGCEGELRKSITVLPTPEPYILPADPFGCSPLAISFEGDPGSMHTWDFGEGPTNSSTHIFVNNTVAPFKNPVILQSRNPYSLCDRTTTTDVTVYPSPTSSIAYENFGGFPQRVRFSNESENFIDCEWLLPDGTVINDCNDIELSFSRNGTNLIKLVTYNTFNCMDTAVISWETMLTGLHIPNAFMPESSDTLVNRFRAVGIGLLQYNLAVYDTWGNLIWETSLIKDTEPVEGWDGNARNGKPMPQDVYIWYAAAIFIDNSTWEGQNGSTSGTLTLIR